MVEEEELAAAAAAAAAVVVFVVVAAAAAPTVAAAVDGGGGVDETAAAVNKPIATALLRITVAEHTLACRMFGGYCNSSKKGGLWQVLI